MSSLISSKEIRNLKQIGGKTLGFLIAGRTDMNEIMRLCKLFDLIAG